MQTEKTISDELRTKGVAASTIHEALGEWREQQILRLIHKLAKAKATLESLLEVKSEAQAFVNLTKELEIMMQNGGIETRL